MSNKHHLTLAIGLLALAGASYGSEDESLRFLIDTSLAPLPADQAQGLQQQLDQSLNQLDDRQQQLWQSEDGTTKASIEPLLSYFNGDQRCRKTELRLQHQGLPEQLFRFELCQQSDGWKMQSTPASQFNDEDWLLLKKSLQQTLNDNDNQQASSWKNLQTHNGGTITPISQQMVSGLSCRRADIELTNIDDQSFHGSYLFCRNKQGRWRRQVE